MNSPLSEELLARLSGFVTGAFGLRFPPDRWTELARGVASAALELGISDLGGWAEALADAAVPPEHVVALGNHLTISETYFFRHPENFALLEREILPERIAARREHSRTLRIWSAGCASGEEAYSVAILIKQRFPELAANRLVIHGTDINSRVLERARRGHYSEWSFRDSPPWLKPGWFRRRAGSRYEIADAVRQMVHFAPLNLASAVYPAEFGERGDFDVILCRNVLMYFSAEWQERIVRRLAQALTPGGWLLTGPCDLTSAQAAALELRPERPGAFHRQAGEGRRLRATEGPPVPAAPELDVPAPKPAASPPRPVVAPIAESPAPTAGVDVVTLAEQAREQADRGELDAALRNCDAALARDALRPELHHLRACVLLELDHVEEAEAAFRRVLYLDADFAMAQFALGMLAHRAGRNAEARHHFSVVLRLLAHRNRGESVPHSEGLTVARLQAVVERTLGDDAA